MLELYYEVHGSGPALLLIPGSNGDAAFYAELADLLADRYTVINYDRRGFSRSAGAPAPRAGWAETHAEDARQLLDAVAGGPASVFGSSAGAIIGLELISRHPQLVTRLIAHEPPLAELLPDATRWRTLFHDVVTTYQQHGAEPAMRMFMAGTGTDTVDRPPHVDAGLISRMPGNVPTILTQEVPNATSYRPDFAALDAQCARITLAGGRLEPGGRRLSRRSHRLLVAAGRLRRDVGRHLRAGQFVSVAASAALRAANSTHPGGVVARCRWACDRVQAHCSHLLRRPARIRKRTRMPPAQPAASASDGSGRVTRCTLVTQSSACSSLCTRAASSNANRSAARDRQSSSASRAAATAAGSRRRIAESASTSASRSCSPTPRTRAMSRAEPPAAVPA